ncbi:MAG: hypothetical protein U1F57_06830 [bacterium]
MLRRLVFFVFLFSIGIPIASAGQSYTNTQRNDPHLRYITRKTNRCSHTIGGVCTVVRRDSYDADFRYKNTIRQKEYSRFAR